MDREFASCLVGLIAIEHLPSGFEFEGPKAEANDATLDGILIDLASRPGPLAPRPGMAETVSHWHSASRFASLDRPAWRPAMRLSANLTRLTAQLELALAEARQRIIAASSSAL